MKILVVVTDADGVSNREESIEDLAVWLSDNEDDGEMAAEIRRAFGAGESAVFGGGAQPIFTCTSYCETCNGECSNLTHTAAMEPEPERIHCDQCQMLSINGVACHETGCPNQRKTWVPDRGWVLYLKCRECGDKVEAGESCDCQEPMEPDDEDDKDDEDDDTKCTDSACRWQGQAHMTDEGKCPVCGALTADMYE